MTVPSVAATAATTAAVAACAVGAAWLAVAGLRRSFMVITVSGASMAPTLRSGDRVLVRRAGLGRIRTGDIIVLGPGADERGIRLGPGWIIKRAAALPGDPIPRDLAPPLSGLPETEVPPGKLLLLGDNAEGSTDSRQTGYFDGHRLVGRVVRQLSGSRAAGPRE